MHILTINTGSSTLKYAVYKMPEEECILLETAEYDGDYKTCISNQISQLAQSSVLPPLDAIAHRVVHGGSYSSAQPINRDVIDTIEQFYSPRSSA